MSSPNEKLQKLESDKLMNIVKNYRQYGYDETIRAAAISILEERGISLEQLALSGNLVNRSYEFAREIYSDFRLNSRLAFIAYSLVFVLHISFPFTLSYASPSFGVTSIVIEIISFIAFIVFLLKSFSCQNQFYKVAGKEYSTEGALLYLFLGMPFYIVMYFIFKNQMKEVMKEIT